MGAARREAGDVAIAVEKGALAWDDVVTMADVARGEVALDPARRVVSKTVGMPWEDLAVARVVGGRGLRSGLRLIVFCQVVVGHFGSVF